MWRFTFYAIAMGLAAQVWAGTLSESDLGFIQAMAGARKAASQPTADGFPVDRWAARMWREFPLQCDWFLQDNQVNDGFGKRAGIDARGDFRWYLRAERDNTLEKKLLGAAGRECGVAAPRGDFPAGSAAWLEAYLVQCRQRRALRLAGLLRKTARIIYATHHNLGTFVYLDTQTHGGPKGSQLRLLDLSPEMQGLPAKDELLLDAAGGILRDPELDFEAKHLLFSWRKSNGGNLVQAALAPATGNYKIHEMELESRQVRQLTSDDTYGADIEPCYLPNGDIVFSSDRCVQEVTCGGGDCTNLYLMDRDGKYARRIGFDQTQTGFPHLLDDGRVLYTRRDYNDRAQTYAHALFIMNPDGTGQAEYYGNNTFEPTSFQHARQIPGARQVMSIAGGYHTDQGGKLCIVDISQGRQDYQGLRFIQWDPKSKISGGDTYGREGEQYIYPFPVDERGFLVGFDPIGGYRLSARGNFQSGRDLSYKLYYMTVDGQRELLASHPELNCAQAVPVLPRFRPAPRASQVDYRKNTGVMFVQNVYLGLGAQGLRPGSIKKVRVCQLYYKPTTIGGGVFFPLGPVGPGKRYGGPGAHSITPVGVGSASFDAKAILGEVEVHADGSAMFEVPARVPVFLQLIDEQGYVAQSMRSWATLMPNERLSCVGCHEDKRNTPNSRDALKQAARQAPQQLQHFAQVSGKPFSYATMVQPIWNRHCVVCHASGKSAAQIDLSDTLVKDLPGDTSFNSTRRVFYQSYLTLLKVGRRKPAGPAALDGGRPNAWVDYWTRLLTVELTPPYLAGSAKSQLVALLKDGHQKTNLSRDEIDTVAAWIDLNVPFIGAYDEMNDWNEAAQVLYREKMAARQTNEAIERRNIQEFIKAGQP